MVDLLRLPSATRAELLALVSFAGVEHLDAVLEAGRGAIIVTAHLGPYELGGACLAIRGYDTTAVVERLAPEVMQALASFREATGMQLIPLERAATGSLRALRRNGTVLLVADRVVGDTTTGVELPFAHGTRRVPTGPAYLSIASGAPVIVAHIVQTRKHNGARYAVQLDSPIVADASLERNESEMDLTRRITARLAAIVASHPDQWFVFQPEWLRNRG